MGEYFVAVGGTGQIAAICYWKILQLLPNYKPAAIYYMDRDTIRDGNTEGNITSIIPDIKYIDPLPSDIKGSATFESYYLNVAGPDNSRDIMNSLFNRVEQQTEIHAGMYGRPPVGASVIKSNFLRSDNNELNNLVNSLKTGNHTVIICGSASGGTGAGGVPSLAQFLDKELREINNRNNVNIYIIFFLKHFYLTLPERDDDQATKIANEQVRRNEESGMCYLKDKIAEGTNGCFLIGLDDPPERLYQIVGSQTEQAHFLHLLAAIQTQRLFSGETMPGQLCGYAIPDEGLSLNKLNVRFSDNNTMREMSLEDLLKLNIAAEEWLLLFKKLLDPVPGFSFIPALPHNFSRMLVKLSKGRDRNVILESIISVLEAKRSQIINLIEWFLNDSKILDKARGNKFIEFIDTNTEFTSREYKKFKKNPAKFIRYWFGKTNLKGISQSNYAMEFCENGVVSLYQVLDEKFLRKI